MEFPEHEGDEVRKPHVWFCIPTANKALCSATFAKWRARGYKTACLIDGNTAPPDNCDWCMSVEKYKGWPWATNLLIRSIFSTFPETEFIVAGGDDMDPEPNVAPDVIAEQCKRHFNPALTEMIVMQPTGDTLGWQDSTKNYAAERICGSPWIGREFARRWNGGRGVFHAGFRHFFCDELLKRQTEACGLLWQRKDLTHFHRHPSRTGAVIPPYMVRNQESWSADERLFREFEQAGFPADVEAYLR